MKRKPFLYTNTNYSYLKPSGDKYMPKAPIRKRRKKPSMFTDWLKYYILVNPFKVHYLFTYIPRDNKAMDEKLINITSDLLSGSRREVAKELHNLSASGASIISVAKINLWSLNK